MFDHVVFLERFTALLSEAMLREKVGKRVDAADVDFSAFGSLHFWIEEFGLHCVVEDEVWNSGRLHTYLQAEPLILRRCPDEGTSRHRPLEDANLISTYPEVPCFGRLGSKVGTVLNLRSKFMRRVWRYTTETRKRIDRLNEELRLPPKYIAMQVRRGDKVAGNRKESVQITGMDFAREAPTTSLPPRKWAVPCVRSDLPQRPSETAKQQENGWFLADVEVLRCAEVCLCTFSSNVGRLVALLRDQRTVSLDITEWTND
ncbi:hypothetical protein AK812_SmicGene25868 [Symbiodinium microadriaticum]|uniref:Uncharacterized protein n=1 Tax=Symbiodinium microadriaticum TaxID=2951 RepID=A0A1Q9DAW7_SYMMI|nr:hypothetical protein AK812_SmicGene25868 [Symbiodinium microadriaticum]